MLIVASTCSALVSAQISPIARDLNELWVKSDLVVEATLQRVYPQEGSRTQIDLGFVATNVIKGPKDLKSFLVTVASGGGREDRSPGTSYILFLLPIRQARAKDLPNRELPRYESSQSLGPFKVVGESLRLTWKANAFLEQFDGANRARFLAELGAATGKQPTK
jgi:hypothetical protein